MGVADTTLTPGSTELHDSAKTRRSSSRWLRHRRYQGPPGSPDWVEGAGLGSNDSILVTSRQCEKLGEG